VFDAKSPREEEEEKENLIEEYVCMCQKENERQSASCLVLMKNNTEQQIYLAK
jgi:hypothetical protein